MRLLRRLPILAAAVFLLVGAAACGGNGGNNESEEGTTTTIGGVQTESHGMKDVSGETGKVEIEMYDNYFEPTILEGKPGQKVTLELKNEGKAAHTLTVSKQSVDQEVQPGDEAEVDITFPQSGELTFVCRFHQSSGMVGALEASS
ncbi:MAG TPA: cupredoxin domain-containing protein [Gaiellaceae bacterium]